MAGSFKPSSWQQAHANRHTSRLSGSVTASPLRGGHHLHRDQTNLPALNVAIDAAAPVRREGLAGGGGVQIAENQTTPRRRSGALSPLQSAADSIKAPVRGHPKRSGKGPGLRTASESPKSSASTTSCKLPPWPRSNRPPATKWPPPSTAAPTGLIGKPGTIRASTEGRFLPRVARGTPFGKRGPPEQASSHRYQSEWRALPGPDVGRHNSREFVPRFGSLIASGALRCGTTARLSAFWGALRGKPGGPPGAVQTQVQVLSGGPHPTTAKAPLISLHASATKNAIRNTTRRSDGHAHADARCPRRGGRRAVRAGLVDTLPELTRLAPRGPLMGPLGLLFAAQMINFTIPGTAQRSGGGACRHSAGPLRPSGARPVLAVRRSFRRRRTAGPRVQHLQHGVLFPFHGHPDFPA